MTKITILLGLCGSGKTYLSNKINKETGAIIFEGVEHYKSLPDIIKCLNEGKNCIVEEISYCAPVNRQKFVNQLLREVTDVTKTNFEIDWICFENDIDSANWNVKRRTNKSDIQEHININKAWYGIYVYPDGIIPVPIHRI